MDDLDALREENQRWHKQHAQWVEEAQKWQRETQRLAALLYLLDRALPEHTATLTKHVLLIEQHEEMVMRYEDELNEKSSILPSDLKIEQEQHEMHRKLCQLHDIAEREHVTLKRQYLKEMERFRTLAKRLSDEN